MTNLTVLINPIKMQEAQTFIKWETFVACFSELGCNCNHSTWHKIVYKSSEVKTIKHNQSISELSYKCIKIIKRTKRKVRCPGFSAVSYQLSVTTAPSWSPARWAPFCQVIWKKWLTGKLKSANVYEALKHLALCFRPTANNSGPPLGAEKVSRCVTASARMAARFHFQRQALCISALQMVPWATE